MATTRLIALHVRKGKSILRSLKDRLDYAQNPDKTEGGELVSSYECDLRTAWSEFALFHREYHLTSGKDRAWGVIAYQIRQSFRPGEITAEEANRIGYETGLRFTKGKHAFVVSTHTDRAHIHNHIIFNSVNLEGNRKFRDFHLSGRAVQYLSDTICVEHGLSILERKQKNDWGKKAFEWGEKGPDHSLSLMVNMEKVLREGKGIGYQKWAEHFNNSRAAEVLIFIQEKGIRTEEQLTKLADGAIDEFNGRL